MEFALLGWPADEPTLRLDYRRFSYAGKFVTGKTGIAVVRDDPDSDTDGAGDDSESDTDAESDDSGSDDATDDADVLSPLPEGVDADAFADDVLAAISFSPDRTDESTLKIRYLTVRSDLRGGGRQLGPKLVAFLTRQAAGRYDRLEIAVNNVFSYHAVYKAGFGYTDRKTGLAELILERAADKPADTGQARYQHGLDAFRARAGLSDAETDFLAAHGDCSPPALLAAVESS